MKKMEKIKVSKDVAKDLEFVSQYSFDSTLEAHMKSEWSEHYSKGFKDLKTKDLASALINGYEVEETPEEKILETFKRQVYWQKTNDIFDKRAHTAYADAILYTLDTLGIKIKGINT